MLETKIERKLVSEVKRRGGLALKLVCPSFSGMPDRLILMAIGKIAFAEVKAPGETPRALQASRHRLLNRLGFKVYVIDDTSQIGGVIDEILAS